MLVYESRILDFSLVQQNSRPTAWPDRFKPGASDMVRKATPVLSKGAQFYYDFYRSDDLKSDKGYYTVSQLMLLGNQYWRENKVEERNLETKVHKLKMVFHEDFERREEAKATGVTIYCDPIINYLEEK